MAEMTVGLGVVNPLAAAEPSAEVVESAIQWSIRMRSGDADSAACERWRAVHPSHELAWQRVQWMCGALCALPPGEASTGVADAFAVAGGRRRRRRQVVAMLAVAAVLPVFVGRRWGDEAGSQAVYASTAPGGYRTVSLGGGGTLRLNTNTAVRLSLEDRAEHVELLRGEIYVDTTLRGAANMLALQVLCPFGSVACEGAAVFAVRLDTGRALVHVEAGEVRLHGMAAGPYVDGLAAPAGGCYELASGGVVPAPQSARLDPLGWVDRVLAARDMSLESFAAELSRYRHASVSVAPEIRDLAVSGVFQVGDVAAALKLLTRMLPVRVAGLASWSRMPVRLLARDTGVPPRRIKM